jgi:hypothetical protein
MNIESVFLNLVDAGLMAKKMDKAMQDAGFDNNPYFEIYGCVAQAIIHMLGEAEKDFENTDACYALSDKIHGRKERVQYLVDAYNKVSSQ